MKKPLFAALGVAGACAACCSIPLLLPLLGGTAVAALLAGWGLDVGIALNVLIAATLVAMVGAVVWLKRRPKAGCENPSTSTQAACALPPGGCGCGPKATS
ncbi:hypothetical protein [Pseudorhodoferax soli]|uniref:Mercuric ion transport protein n=1 Tax=Pseudorhodoferax soli TaxID=545864 RepID=A0A368XHV6_9BURK|nr:hypothetical protein [Pseudorhodoferax soli]RCW66077.1 hypothetical protein DES41_11135 [Pseudorhodoferax soli]